MRAILCLVFIAGLPGCATDQTSWEMPSGRTEQQFRQDQYACLQESQYRSSSANIGPYGGSAQSGQNFNLNLATLCMQARGYRQVKSAR